MFEAVICIKRHLFTPLIARSWFSGSRVGVLYRKRDPLNKESNKRILQRHVGQGLKVQQDFDPKHLKNGEIMERLVQLMISTQATEMTWTEEGKKKPTIFKNSSKHLEDTWNQILEENALSFVVKKKSDIVYIY